MTLSDYLEAESLTDAVFAEKIGCDRSTVTRIRKGEQNIKRDLIRRIVRATDGRVTAEALVFDHEASSTADRNGSACGKSAEISTRMERAA